MEKAIMTQIEKWKNSAVLTEAEKKELEAMTQEELASAFARDLEFGTAGLRGVMGLGTARMNIYVIRRATKGLAIYLKNHFQAPKVVISYEDRKSVV